MSGVSLAWLLDGRSDVLLLEARDAIGGNVQSISVGTGGQTVVVDMGAQYFHPGPYPTYVKLLAVLGLLREAHSFPASITMDRPGPAKPLFVSPVLPGRAWPLLADWNRAGLEAFRVAFSAAKEREEANASYSLTLGEWLPTLGLSGEQWAGMILPWAASVFTGNIAEAQSFSARAAMVFAAKALPDRPTDPLMYYCLKPGMAEPLRRMLAQCSTVRLVTQAPVTAVARQSDGAYLVTYGGGQQELVDELVFACPGSAALQLLTGLAAVDEQRAALAGIQFAEARLMLHTDPVYASSTNAYRSFFNGRTDGGYCEASMWLQDVVGADIWKSWVTHRSTLPTQILHQAQYRHMVPTIASLQAQDALRPLQGRENIWFAGSYLYPFDAQETALRSAIAVAQGIGAAGGRLNLLD